MPWSATVRRLWQRAAMTIFRSPSRSTNLCVSCDHTWYRAESCASRGNLMGSFGAWWHLLTSVGPGLRAGRQSDTMFRYYVHQSLADIGFFEYLAEPRTYGEILARFGFIESEYTREVMETLVNDFAQSASADRRSLSGPPPGSLPVFGRGLAQSQFPHSALCLPSRRDEGQHPRSPARGTRGDCRTLRAR